MNKSQLRDFAITSRVALIGCVKLRAYAYGVTEEKAKANKITPSAQQLNPTGGLLTNEERTQRDELLRQIEQKGFAQVMEEAAYTWFNRFIAFRYMENAQLLPIRQRVFARKGEVRPEMIADALNVEIDGLERARMISLIESHEDERLYKLQLIALSSSLHAVLPQMFEAIDNYTELLFPDGLLQKESVLAKMAALDDENWQNIEVVGWLYQYYNTELKDETFALLKQNVKITKERIGAATQLFTPEWIVRYMVENSLGRLWLEGHENAALQSGWKYYLPEAEQEPQVAERLKEMRKDASKLRPEEITVIDPCMGSGHILVAAFAVLMDIYRSAGYTDRDAVRSIIENNLYGLDIDDRAAQLAYFAVMMKACSYDKRFLRRADVPQPHVCAIQESNRLKEFDKLQGQLSLDTLCLNTANALIRTFHDAKEYGSILDVQIDGLENADALMAQLRAIATPDFALSMWLQRAETLLPQLAMQAEIMQRKYDVVVTNPPYMGSSGMGAKLAQYVKENYPDSKSDLFAVFIEKCGEMLTAHGYQAMITQHAWMFLSSFEKLRDKLQKREIVNMAHLGARAFEEIGGEVVQTASFVLCKNHIAGYKGSYCRLIEPTTQQGKEDMFLAGENQFTAQQDNFAKIPGSPIAYWVSEAIFGSFDSGIALTKIAPTRKGMFTGNNDLWLKFWHEIDFTKFCQKHKPYNKGGEFRRWYGNNDYVVNWDNNGSDITSYSGSGNINVDLYFKPCVTWSLVTSYKPSFRAILDNDHVMGDAGPIASTKNKDTLYILGLLNSKPVESISAIIAPTINFSNGAAGGIPVIYDKNQREKIETCVQENINISKSDWDSFETSWDFKWHPLLEFRGFEGMPEDRPKRPNCTIASTYHMWDVICSERFRKLKANEEELNRIFIDIYGLQDELTPEVADKDVTVRLADLARDIRSLISYAVGCMMGRYSLDVQGLAYAGGEWDASKYTAFLPDKDAILPIADDEYYDDDTVNRFVHFVEVVYGVDTLEENLRFIADALGGEGKPPKDVIRAYFLNDFYKDHLKVYQKRPIYWLFDSGKQNGFKALVYLHRYDRDTLARMRTDYVHPQQERLRTQIEGENHAAQTGDARRKAVAAKRLDKLQKQLIELAKFEEQLHHLADERIVLDLDDGVKVNYAKMGVLVQPIK